MTYGQPIFNVQDSRPDLRATSRSVHCEMMAHGGSPHPPVLINSSAHCTYLQNPLLKGFTDRVEGASEDETPSPSLIVLRNAEIPCKGEVHNFTCELNDLEEHRGGRTLTSLKRQPCLKGGEMQCAGSYVKAATQSVFSLTRRRPPGCTLAVDDARWIAPRSQCYFRVMD